MDSPDGREEWSRFDLHGNDSNFIIAYVVTKIGVHDLFALAAQGIGNSNDGAATKSWVAGVKVAEGADYDVTVEALVRDIWDEGAEKERKLWPNTEYADNWVTRALFLDVNVEFSSPGFLELSDP